MKLIPKLGLAILASLAAVASAEAKTCKDPLTATSRSTIAGGEDARTKRATSNAQKKWSKDARAKAGLQYQFWFRSDDQNVDCHQTPKSTVCKVTAKPCSII